MPPCHTKPFIQPGVLTPPTQPLAASSAIAAECCDYCGSPHLEWRKCKQICPDCRQINKSCADL